MHTKCWGIALTFAPVTAIQYVKQSKFVVNALYLPLGGNEGIKYIKYCHECGINNWLVMWINNSFSEKKKKKRQWVLLSRFYTFCFAHTKKGHTLAWSHKYVQWYLYTIHSKLHCITPTSHAKHFCRIWYCCPFKYWFTTAYYPSVNCYYVAESMHNNV